MDFKVFIDTNILIDILLEREPFFELSQRTVGEIVGSGAIPFISGASVTDLYYICRRAGLANDVLLDFLKESMEIYEVLSIDKRSIIEAISSGIKDFEDAVQLMACKQESIDLIITRNKKDYKNKWIEVQTPEEYLAETTA